MEAAGISMVTEKVYGAYTEQVESIISAIPNLTNDQIVALAYWDNDDARMVWASWYDRCRTFPQSNRPSWDADDAIAAVMASEQWLKIDRWLPTPLFTPQTLWKAEVTTRYVIFAVVAQDNLHTWEFNAAVAAWVSIVAPLVMDKMQ